MSEWLDRLTSREGRKWLYGVSMAAIPLLILAGKLTNEQAAAVLNFIAAILGIGAPAMALSHLTPLTEPKDSINVPEDLNLDVPLDIEEEA